MLPRVPHGQPSRGLDAASVLPLDHAQGDVALPAPIDWSRATCPNPLSNPSIAHDLARNAGRWLGRRLE